MAKCPNCGALVGDSVDTCTYCGAALGVVDRETGRTILDETRSVRGAAEEILHHVSGGDDPFANSALLGASTYKPLARLFGGAQVMARTPRAVAQAGDELDLYVEDPQENYVISQQRFEKLYENGDVIEWNGGYLRDSDGHRYHITRAVNPSAPGRYGLGSWHRCPYCLLLERYESLRAEYAELTAQRNDAHTRAHSGGAGRQDARRLAAQLETRLGSLHRQLDELRTAIGQATPLLGEPLAAPADRQAWVQWVAYFLAPADALPQSDRAVEILPAAQAAKVEARSVVPYIVFGLLGLFMLCWFVYMLGNL